MARNPSMRTQLSRVRGLGSAKSGTEHFWLQRLTAAANVPLAIAFLFIVILLTGRDHAGALALVSHPLVSILLLLFVISGLTHMRIGMQVIIEDYVHGEKTKLAALLANTFFAVAMGVAAIYAILKIGFGA